MRKLALGLVAPTLATIALAAVPALAQTSMTFGDVDADASGELSFTELQTVWTDLSEDEFNAVDLDMNGSLNVDELNALQPSAQPAPAPAPAPDGADGMTVPEVPLDPASE